MYAKQIKQLHSNLKHTNKVIIGLGCSFVQGQGAVDDDLYLKYKWEHIELGRPLEIQLTDKERKELLKAYPIIGSGLDNKLDFTFMEYENAFVNVLCNKYFNKEYAPINLALRGCGNRATIKELYFLPDIDYTKLDDIIVVYCPSGLERFDFANDSWPDHFHWRCMWPHYENMEPSSRKNLWEGYKKTIWSEKQGVIEQIAHAQELLLWCKYHKATLIITPGFDRRYNKTDFENFLKSEITRTMDGDIITEKRSFFSSKENTDLLNLFPWKNMFAPQGHQTFIDMVMAQEESIEKTDFFFQFLGKGSPNGWITPCSHPSAKAHDLFAKELYNQIKNNCV